MIKNIFKKKGMALVEIVVSVAIISVGLMSATTSYSIYVNYALANQMNSQSAFLLEEELEAVSFIRDKNWALIAGMPSGTQYLSWNGTTWATSTSPEYVDGRFLRSFTVSAVARDANNRIASSGTNDPYTKKITASVSYFQGHATTTKSISTYITDLYD